jgi:hypothetical protein
MKEKMRPVHESQDVKKKKKRVKTIGLEGVAHEVEYLPSKREALGYPVPQKKKL